MLSSGVDACGDAWEEVAISSGTTESVLSRLSGSFAPMEGVALWAADVGLLGVVCVTLCCPHVMLHWWNN